MRFQKPRLWSNNNLQDKSQTFLQNSKTKWQDSEVLRLPIMMTKLSSSRLWWLDYVKRMDDSCIPKLVLYGRLVQERIPSGNLQLLYNIFQSTKRIEKNWKKIKSCGEWIWIWMQYYLMTKQMPNLKTNKNNVCCYHDLIIKISVGRISHDKSCPAKWWLAKPTN